MHSPAQERRVGLYPGLRTSSSSEMIHNLLIGVFTHLGTISNIATVSTSNGGRVC